MYYVFTSTNNLLFSLHDPCNVKKLHLHSDSLLIYMKILWQSVVRAVTWLIHSDTLIHWYTLIHFHYYWLKWFLRIKWPLLGWVVKFDSGPDVTHLVDAIPSVAWQRCRLVVGEICREKNTTISHWSANLSLRPVLAILLYSCVSYTTSISTLATHSGVKCQWAGCRSTCEDPVLLDPCVRRFRSSRSSSWSSMKKKPRKGEIQ